MVSQVNGRSIASVTFFNLGEHFDRHEQESYANARLIASAPDLLRQRDELREALKALHHYVVFDEEADLSRAEFDEMYASAERALSRAGEVSRG